MAAPDDRSVDYCVVGAGMAGLTFAALAAARGRRVLVLEQHYLPGGCFTAFRNGPYLFNVALEWTTDCAPGQPFERLLRTLGLADAYRFEPIEVFKAALAPGLAQPLRFPAGAEALVASLGAAFPHEQAAIGRFVADALTVAGDEPGGKALLMRHGIKPVAQMLADYFADDLLRQALYSLVACPCRGVLLLYMVGAIAAGQVWRPAHRDHRRLASLLHRRIHALGSRVRFRAAVEGIVVEQGRACGVRLADGTRIDAGAVVCTADPAQLVRRLLPPASTPAPRLAADAQAAPGLSCFSLFLGLDRLPAGLQPGLSAHALLSAGPRWATDPHDLAHIPLRLELQSAEHPGLAPPGHATLCAWAALPMCAFDHWGQGAERDPQALDRPAYARARQAAVDIVMARLEAALPGIGATVRVLDAATPYTYKRYTGAQGGSVSGYSLTDLGYLKNRPHDTGIEGLYQAGHWVTQSGVNTVMASAWSLDQALHAREQAAAA